VPFAGVIAVFTGLVDLLPLVGATIGGAVAVLAGFVHSVTAGIAVLAFFVVYQQLENHLLQPMIMSRTVKLNPLAVFAAVLAGVELAGVLGALLAIPVAAMIQIIARDVYDHRRGRLKTMRTTGEDEMPTPPAGSERTSRGGTSSGWNMPAAAPAGIDSAPGHAPADDQLATGSGTGAASRSSAASAVSYSLVPEKAAQSRA